MQEFVFLKGDDEVVLDDKIKVLETSDNGAYLVSNSKLQKAEIYAPEINFYLKNSKDSILQKSKNSLLLYEARALAFDLARDVDYSKEIGSNVILISDLDESEILSFLSDFKVIKLSHDEVKFLYGCAGDLSAILHTQDGEVEIDFDLLLVRDAKPYMLKQSGCFEINGLSASEIKELLGSKSPRYHYKSLFSYDLNICQYHKRRTEHCSKCVDACPSVAILKDDEKRELVFSHIDCTGCGNCVSICPSGALEMTKLDRMSFLKLANLFKDKKILLTSEIESLCELSVDLPENVVVFALPSPMLDYLNFMTLLQISGANLVYFSEEIFTGLMENVSLINEIYMKIFNQNGVILADKSNLQKALDEQNFIPNSKFEINEYGLAKREIFAKRLQALVGDNDYGRVESKEWVRYGSVSVNEASCTLCLSCVGACNVGALFADNSDNSLKFNPSLCTTCGYCITSCAEKDTIFLNRDGIALNPSFFEYKTLAKDDLFACVECGKEFATTKSVEKIFSLMQGAFSKDPLKLKTLKCCSDCKAKIMIQAQHEAMMKGMEYE